MGGSRPSSFRYLAWYENEEDCRNCLRMCSSKGQASFSTGYEPLLCVCVFLSAWDSSMPLTLQSKHAEEAAASSDVASGAEHAEPDIAGTMPRTAKVSELEQVCTWAGEAR